jgi:hypothetical protein
MSLSTIPDDESDVEKGLLEVDAVEDDDIECACNNHVCAFTSPCCKHFGTVYAIGITIFMIALGIGLLFALLCMYNVM